MSYVKEYANYIKSYGYPSGRLSQTACNFVDVAAQLYEEGLVSSFAAMVKMNSLFFFFKAHHDVSNIGVEDLDEENNKPIWR